MYVSNKSPKYFCRKCRNKFPIEDLEKHVHRNLKEYFGQPEQVVSRLQEADRNLTEKSDLLETHRHEIQKVKESMRMTEQLYLDKQISGDGFRRMYSPAEERLTQLEKELPKLEAEVDFLKVNKLSADDLLHEATSQYERWPKMPTDDKRRIVEALIEKLIIGDGEIEIKFCYPLVSEELCKNQQRLGPG